MNAQRYKNPEGPIVVKVGSESADFDSAQGREKLSRLAFEISFLMSKTNRRVVLVTSGAVAHGRKVLGISKDRALGVEERRALASIGQHRLIAHWEAFFASVDSSVRIPAVGQGLVTHAEIEADISHSNGLMSGLEGLWNLGALPILNENDFATPEEIVALGKGADNDKNSLLIARMVRAEHLAIMTNTNGVYRKATDPESRVPVFHASRLSDDDIARICAKEKSKSGTGGMASKLAVARDAADEGMKAHIFNGTDSTLLEHVEDSHERHGGTVIVP